MKYYKIIVSTCVVLFSFCINSGQAITITGFGTGDFAPTLNFNGAQTANDISAIGNGTTQLTGDFVSPVSVGIPASLDLTVNLGIPAAWNFDLILQDIDGDQLEYSGNWSSFGSGGFNTGSLAFVTQNGSFDGTPVTMAIFQSGTTGDTLFATFDNLEAVPEPSSALLLGLGGGLLYFLRCRK